MDKDIINGQNLEKSTVVSEYEVDHGTSYKFALSAYIPDVKTLDEEEIREIVEALREHSEFLCDVMCTSLLDEAAGLVQAFPHTSPRGQNG